MEFDKQLVAGKLRRWEKYIDEYRLPNWDDIPDIGLYMEQVINLLKEYMDYMPPELKEEQFITPATINNYVRKKIMPEPINKKYYRNHIAYLIMILSLKQCLAFSTLQTMVPMGMSDEELRDTYSAYVERHRRATKYFTDQVRLVAGGILDHQELTDMSTAQTSDLIFSTAIISGFARLLTEKLVLLSGKDLSNGGSIKLHQDKEEHTDK